jgi:hypothetical protein
LNKPAFLSGIFTANLFLQNLTCRGKVSVRSYESQACSRINVIGEGQKEQGKRYQYPVIGLTKDGSRKVKIECEPLSFLINILFICIDKFQLSSCYG